MSAHLHALPDGPSPVTLYLDGQLWLADKLLHYFDRTSMAHSLEVRVPFLDHEFVELAARIPPDLKVRRTTTKYLLRQAALGADPGRRNRQAQARLLGWYRRRLVPGAGDSRDSAVSSWQPQPLYAELLDPGTKF